MEPDYNKNEIEQQAEKKKGSIVFPYLEIKKEKDKYLVYEGEFGQNRYKYWEFGIKSKQGQLCKKHFALVKALKKSGKRDNDTVKKAESTLGEILSLPVNSDGSHAYMKYWNDCHTVDEKVQMDFIEIPYLKALEEWYELRQKYFKPEIYSFSFNDWRDYQIDRINKLQSKGFLSKDHKDELKKFIDFLEVKPRKGKPDTDNKTSMPQTLKEIFVSEDAYNDTLKLLAKEQMTDKDTRLWIDKANGYKSRIVALLNDLFYKGYYNTDQMPMPETLMSIAKNTLGVEISKRMFHSESIPAIRKEYFYFIPKHATN